MKEFYLALRTYLLAQVTDILHLRMWNNQLDYMESGEQIPFNFPAVFVDFSNIEYFDLGNKWQNGTLQVDLHICDEMWNGADQEENLQIFDLKELIYKSLSQIQLDTASPITRIAEQTDTTHTNIYHYIQSYKVEIVANAEGTIIELTDILLNLTAVREITNYDLMTKPKYE